MRLILAGVFVFLSVLLSALYFPLTAPVWLKGIVLVVAFTMATLIARKYIHFSFERDHTDKLEEQFELIKENHHES